MEFIKGIKGRGRDVITLLESRGGKDTGSITGESDDFLYYIDTYYHNSICYCHINSSIGEMMLKHGVELQLPKPPIFKDVKFGDLFKTRGGGLAVFLSMVGGVYKYKFYIEGKCVPNFYDSYGSADDGYDLDIVGRF